MTAARPARMHRPFARPLAGLALAAGLAACGGADDTGAPAPDPDAPAATREVAASADQEMTTTTALAGSFRDAGAGAPAVLIVPGSGPTDRNGNGPDAGPLPLKAQSLRLLADGLAAQGVSSLRVDKRGMFGSLGAGDGNDVTVDLYAQDYLDWAEMLREKTGRPCVYLLGHSEGGTMVSAAAARDNAGICGLVLVAAPGRPLGDILREQLRANPANAPVLDDAMGAIDALEAGERVDVSAMHPALQSLFTPAVQGYWISLFSVDPADLIEEAGVPVLVLQGTRDLQVKQADAERLGRSGAEVVLLPGVNHVLKNAPEMAALNYATYTKPDLPLADGIVAPIADFVKQDR